MTPAILLAAALQMATADPFASFELRANAIAADEACGLFEDPRHRAALRASLSRSVAEVVALGADPERVDAEIARIRASRAASDCASAATVALGREARAAAEAYLRAFRMTAPSPAPGRSWSADRTPRSTGDWLLHQEAGASRLGKAVLAEGDRVVFALDAARRPVSVMLVARDPGLAPQKIDATRNGLFPAPDENGLARYAPPEDASLRFWASGRIDAASARALMLSARSAHAFLLPETALEAVAALDPREAVFVEVRYAGGASERYWYQAGGLSAALDFLRLARQPV